MNPEEPRPLSATPWAWPFKKVYYGWGIVGAAMVATFASAPMFGPVLGVFVKPMGDDLGWSRATIALAFTIGTLAGTLLSAAVGAYLDRHGARGIMIISGMVVAGCLLGMALMTEPWHHWVAFGGGRAIAIAGTQFGTTIAVANWFIRRRGRAMGFAGAGLRIGQAVLPMMLYAIIATWTWRHGFVALAALALVFIVVPSAVYIRRRPEDMGLYPDGIPPEAAPVGGGGGSQANARRGIEESWTLREAIRTRALWLVVLATGGTLFVNGSVNLHAVANFQDRGIHPALAVSITAIFAATSVVATFGFGFLTERIHVRYGAMAASLLYLAAMVVIINAETYPMAVFFAIVFGAANGGWTTGERLLLANYFGRRHLGSIRGFAAPLRGLVSPFGAVIAGLVRDNTGSYNQAFLMFAVMSLVVFMAMLLAPPPRKPAARE